MFMSKKVLLIITENLNITFKIYSKMHLVKDEKNATSELVKYS